MQLLFTSVSGHLLPYKARPDDWMLDDLMYSANGTKPAGRQPFLSACLRTFPTEPWSHEAARTVLHISPHPLSNTTASPFVERPQRGHITWPTPRPVPQPGQGR